MDKDSCIYKICSLPLNLIEENKSASMLADESQFFIFHKYISFEDIENHLTNHLDLIDAWHEWSNNKPRCKGFYLLLDNRRNLIIELGQNGLEVFGKTFNSKIKACAEYIFRELVELVSVKGESNYQQNLDVLVDASIEIGNLMKGERLSAESQIVYFAEGLGQKIINHTLTARYLFSGYQLSDGEHLFEPKVDYASIIVLTRAALETYLALNYIFIAEHDEDQKQFRFLCWDLAGYLDRANFQSKKEEHIALKQSEGIAIKTIEDKLAENSIFRALSPHEKKKVLRGEWRINFRWHDLASKAGFSDTYFKQQYKFLCSYAHASRLSIIQIQQNKTFEQQREMAKNSIQTLMVVLAKHMYDYIEVMPQLNAIKGDLPKYPIILFWKSVGEKILQPENEECYSQ